MASGHLCLNLSEKVNWEDFAGYAEQLLRVLNGCKLDATESPDIRIWSVAVHGHVLRLVFDDYPAMLSLESSDDHGDTVLRRVELQLMDMKRS
jgi:hypothetical protein